MSRVASSRFFFLLLLQPEPHPVRYVVFPSELDFFERPTRREGVEDDRSRTTRSKSAMVILSTNC